MRNVSARLRIAGLMGLAVFLGPALYAQTTSKSLGSGKAPVTMQVFTDFECPACATYYLETLRPVIRDYVAKDKANMTFVILTAPRHPLGYRAALYANAAARCGVLEKVMEVLYTRQRTWMQNGDVDGVLAAALTADELKKVNAEMEKDIHLPVENDLALARSLRVSSTPTTFITHRGKRTPVVGAVSYAILRTYLESLLKER